MRGTGSVAGLLAGMVILGPALMPGYLLVYDMVFVPDPNFGERALGLDGSVPRAVPTDLVVSVLSLAAPGWMVQKVLLLGMFALVGGGIGGLVRTRLGAVAGALAACWNPYVAERLAIGHWSFLLGYALLPWVARSCIEVLAGGRGARPRLAMWLVIAAAFGSTSAIMAGLTAATVLLLPVGPAADVSTRVRVGAAGLLVGVTALANAAWWFPAVVRPGRLAADPDGVAAFAARPDTPLGLWGSLLTGGGIWHGGLWPPERASAVLSAVALAATIFCVIWALKNWKLSHPATLGLFVVGVLGVLLAAAGRTLLADGATAFVVHVPGGGLIRDSQKFLAPSVIFVAFAVGTTAEGLWDTLRSPPVRIPRHTAVMLVLAVLLWPVVTLPSLAWGSAERWAASDYPSGFRTVAERIDGDGGATTAVFPWTLYRRYDWNRDVVLLDPWNRLLESRVLVNDDLPLSSLTVQGEEPAAERVSKAVAAGGPGDVVGALRAEGVRYVVFHRDQPTSEAESEFFVGQEQAWADAHLVLYDLGPASTGGEALPRWAGLGLLASTAVGVAVLAALIVRTRRLPRITLR